MAITTREKAIAVISNGITIYSILQEQNKLQDTTIYDFILKSIPEDVKSEVTADLIDEIFVYVSSSHNS